MGLLVTICFLTRRNIAEVEDDPMLWLVNFYMAATAFVMTLIEDAPEQVDHHSWTDAELHRMTPEAMSKVPGIDRAVIGS